MDNSSLRSKIYLRKREKSPVIATRGASKRGKTSITPEVMEEIVSFMYHLRQGVHMSHPKGDSKKSLFARGSSVYHFTQNKSVRLSALFSHSEDKLKAEAPFL